MEAKILIRAACEANLPRLVAADAALFQDLLADLFPAVPAPAPVCSFTLQLNGAL